MPFAPGALRSGGRKAAYGLRSSNHQHGSGGMGTRALHTPTVRLSTGHYSDLIHKITTTLEQIRPRTPTHTLFSSTKGFFTNVFTRLAAPGIRVPLGPNLGRSLVQARPITIQSGLSLPVRHAIRNNNFRSGSFLPRAPQVPVRGPIASQMGLGTARNFSSGRPIFQNLVDNVPIAVRALYETDLDDLNLGHNKRMAIRRVPVTCSKKTHVPKVSKLKVRSIKSSTSAPKLVDEKAAVNPAELERYFAAPEVSPVTTYLLIPLAPTPTNRVPLSALALDDLSSDPTNGRFLPLSQIGQIHGTHTNHALRVSTLFARLDQAHVWSRGGVVCSAYSGPGAGIIRPRRRSAVDELKLDSGAANLEGICTILKVEFQGWTEAEVRGVMGETATGWCVMEEVWRVDEEDDQGMLSAAEDEGGSLFSSGWSSPAEPAFDFGMPAIDPAHSVVLPTLDFSSSFLAGMSEREVFASRHKDHRASDLEYEDPWAGFEDGSDYECMSSSSSSSFEEIVAGLSDDSF